MRRRIAALVALSLTTALSPLVTLPAQGDNYAGATGRVHNCADPAAAFAGNNMQDPNPHTFFYNNLEGAMTMGMNHARGVYDQTSIDTSLLGSVGSLTDVVAYDNDYSTYCFRTWHPVGDNPIIGLATCVSLASGGKCEKHEVRYDLSYVNATSDTRRRNVACHETGHTVGLEHRNADGGCMYDRANDNEGITWHDVEHINGGPWIICCQRRLYPGQHMFSYDGRFKAAMQWDGNFVVYGPAGVYWATNTDWVGSSAFAEMQGDGNFVIYSSSAYGNSPICSTGTWMYPGSTLEMQGDGNLVVYSPGHIARWASEPSGVCR